MTSKPTQPKEYKDYTELYAYFLSLLDDTEAIAYMESRGIKKLITQCEKIKNLPKDTRPIQKALTDRYDIDTLLDSGLYAIGKNDKPYLSLFSHRLIIPYTYKGKIETLQGRLIDTIDPNTEYNAPKYKLLPNRPVPLYNAIAIDTAHSSYKKLCICEGVLDVLSMYEMDDLIKEYGSPIGIAGVTNYKALLPLLEGLQITIATDQDTAGNNFIYNFSSEYIDRCRIEPQYITFNIRWNKRYKRLFAI